MPCRNDAPRVIPAKSYIYAFFAAQIKRHCVGSTVFAAQKCIYIKDFYNFPGGHNGKILS